MATNSRSVAAKVLCRVLEDGQSLTAALDNVRSEPTSPRDRAFVQALCFGTMRWYFRLDFILGRLLRKPLKHQDVHALALLGLYQLSYTRVKPHAAVAETVSALRSKPWARSLLNAVLRSYQRDRDRLEALADASEVGRTAHPAWLLSAVRRDWPTHAEEIFRANNEAPPMVLRVSARHYSPQNYVALLAERQIDAAVSAACPGAVVLDAPVDVALLPGFAEGWVSVQDAAAQWAATLLDVRSGHRVLDVCAAPGGKAMHLLEVCPDVGGLVAVDVDPARLERVRENLARGCFNATLLVGDAGEPANWWDGRPFDRILLDAPCSATGVIRRHPDIKVLRRSADIDALCRNQRRILDAVWPLLAPGGVMLYATCSVLRRENALQIASFLAAHNDATALSVDIPWGVSEDSGRQILTGEGGMDGFFYARIGKQGG